MPKPRFYYSIHCCTRTKNSQIYCPLKPYGDNRKCKINCLRFEIGKEINSIPKCRNAPSHVLCLWWLLHECTCSNLFWFKFLFSHSCRFPRNSLAVHIHRIHVCQPRCASESYCNVKTSRVHLVRAVHEEGYGRLWEKRIAWEIL